MRRGCYNRPQGGLNAFNICVREFPQDLDAVLPMELDLDRDPLRFIVTKLPEKGVLLSVDEDSGLFSFQPNEGVTADWDSFKYYITDCPRGCTPENGCLTKTPPGCANTVNVTVSIRIGDPSGMRGRSKSYSVWEDRILATGWIDPTSPGIPGGLVQLERSTFEEAEWSNAEAAAAQLR